MKTIVPLIYSKSGEYLEGALVFTQIDHLKGAFCLNGEVLSVPDSLRNTQFSVAAGGYSGYSQSIDLGEGDKQIRVGLAADPNRPQDIILPGLDKCSVIQPPPPSTPIEKIVVDGRGFKTVSGKDWQQQNITGFKLFYNYIHGVDIRPFCSWASQLGNTVRVFFTCKNEFDLRPSDFTAKQILDFHDKIRAYNLHCEVVAFADYTLVFGDDHDSAIDYYRRLCETLQQVDNRFLELVNEYDVGVNALPIHLFDRPTGIISSHGSGGGDVEPVTPPWDYMTFHLARTNEWPRKAKSAMELEDTFHVPCTNNETNRPDLAGNVVSDFRDCGHVSGLLSAGTNAHSIALKHAEVPVGPELECVEAILKAAKQVPSRVQVQGFYTRGQADSGGTCPMFHSDDTALRTFARIIDNESWCVIVRPTPDNPRKAIDGWKITENWDNLYHLVRT